MRKHILAVDDSKAIRFLLQTVLGKDYHVVTVPDGYSAVYYLANRTLPDLIIADPQLPDMENWELVKQLSTSGMFSPIPLVVLSGLTLQETEAKCMEYRVAHYLLKPFNPVHMVETIHGLVQTEALDRDFSSVN